MEDKQKKSKELYLEFQMLDQHIRQLHKQLEAVTQQLVEFTVTSSNLDEFKKISAGTDIFAPLSSGIFAKASIKDTSDLLVNIGANVVVKKDIDSTKKLIQNQAEEIKKIQKQLIDNMEKMTNND